MESNNQSNQNQGQQPSQASGPQPVPPQAGNASAPAAVNNPQNQQGQKPASVPAASVSPKPSSVPPVTQKTTPKAAPVASTSGGKRNLLISGIIIVVVLAALIVAPRMKNNQDSATGESATEETVGDEETGATASDASTDESPALSRAEAITAFSGKSIKVSGDCEVTPETQSQPHGTTILVDNDTDATHTVSVGPKSYTVSGKHYTLSWLNVAPGTLIVTCDGEDTGARITVQ